METFTWDNKYPSGIVFSRLLWLALALLFFTQSSTSLEFFSTQVEYLLPISQLQLLTISPADFLNSAREFMPLLTPQQFE